MTLENILIHAEVLKEDEFKKMNFQLYGKIGFYHAVYSKGDQYYLIRKLDRNQENTRYMILEIWHQNHKKRQEIDTYGEKRVFERDDHSRESSIREDEQRHKPPFKTPDTQSQEKRAFSITYIPDTRKGFDLPKYHSIIDDDLLERLREAQE